MCFELELLNVNTRSNIKPFVARKNAFSMKQLQRLNPLTSLHRTVSEIHALAPIPADRDPSPHTQGAADRQVFCDPPLHLRAPSPFIASRFRLLR